MIFTIYFQMAQLLCFIFEKFYNKKMEPSPKNKQTKKHPIKYIFLSFAQSNQEVFSRVKVITLIKH